MVEIEGEDLDLEAGNDGGWLKSLWWSLPVRLLLSHLSSALPAFSLSDDTLLGNLSDVVS